MDARHGQDRHPELDPHRPRLQVQVRGKHQLGITWDGGISRPKVYSLGRQVV